MMSSFQVVDSSPGSSMSIMETSNFAHVIFQNVGKSFLPQSPLECCYTLTAYITPHPKDWVGIFKSDGEFYQFCYVTHTGDIRGASTPFLFKPATPTDELLTRLKQQGFERDGLESQLKSERDERDRYKVTIAQFQEELERLRACVAQRDCLEKELHAQQAHKAELGRVREQLRQAEDQLQACRQQASMLAAELRDSAGTRDRTVAELYRARLEAEKLRASLADAQAECRRTEDQLDRLRSATAQTDVSVVACLEGVASGEGGASGSSLVVVTEAEAELQREVEELKLRLHMAAEHYKEKQHCRCGVAGHR
ncbi:hypothetical protein CRUP_022740 [Coryphaenoides rupestris]|nr:hypothetical protein CRUP_022740 [Coryphaenoides rupestris]